MARASTIPYLQGVLKGLVRKRESAVKKLNAKPHFVPLTFNTLKVSLPYLANEEAKLNTLVSELDAFVRKYATLTIGALKLASIDGRLVEPEDIIAALKKGPLRVANSSGDTIGVLYSSYSTAQSNLFTGFLNKKLTDYVNKEAYVASNRMQGFDVGHTYIPSESKLSDLADTPLSLQVSAVKNILGVLSSSGAGKEFEVAAKEAYGKLYDEKFIKSATFRLGKNQISEVQEANNRITSFFQKFISKHSYGQKVAIYLNKDIKGTLLSINANIVLIQDREENQGDFASIENALKRELDSILPTMHFSKNITEEIASRVAESIAFGTIRSKNVSVKKKIEADSQTKKVRDPSSSSRKVSLKTRPIRLRNIRGQFTSIASLEALIRASLYETIKENMVSPRLNYRTGRFAESVKLESMSMDRQANITAFLSYMKYPYATFEPGGAQGSIDRSPTQLIGISVREIAARLVTSRLKTVVV